MNFRGSNYSAFVLTAVCFMSCQARERTLEAEPKASPKNQYDNTRLSAATFGDGGESSSDANGDNYFGDDGGLTEGNGDNCFVIEHINDTYGFTSLFNKRGDRTVAVFVPLPEEMKGWNITPPSESEARKMIFGNRVSGNNRKKVTTAKIVDPTFKTSEDAGPGSIPAQTTVNGKTYQIHSAGEFGTEDCPKKTITEEGMRSPLIVDFSGEGLSVSNISDGVHFDIAGNGLEQVAWPYVVNDTPWLVFDMDLDGRIEGINELFGDQTQSRDHDGFENGFEALSIYDDNKDGVIDQNDAIFDRLQLWRDLNRDGISDPGELESFARRVRSLSLNYLNQFEEDDDHGNMSRQRSSLVGRDGIEYVVFDLWLATETNRS